MGRRPKVLLLVGTGSDPIGRVAQGEVFVMAEDHADFAELVDGGHATVIEEATPPPRNSPPGILPNDPSITWSRRR